MNTADAITNASKELASASPSPALDAEVLLSFVMKKPREYILTHPDQAISKPQFNKYKSFITKRVQGVPVSYITNKKEFFGNSFFVNKDVLIPRPSTETLVEEAIKLINEKDVNSIADIGTGSGCIAISLALIFPETILFATDISSKALMVARKNAKTHKIKNITFLKGNLLAPIKSKSIQLIISNPPYLDALWPKASTKHEPSSALISSQDGLFHVNKIINQSKKYYGDIVDLLLEIDPRQASSLKSFAIQKFPKAAISIVKDLEEHDRVLKVTN